MQIKKLSLSISLVLLLVSSIGTQSAAAQSQDAEILREVHNALFESYFPVHKFDSNIEIKEILQRERDESWTAFSQYPPILQMLSRLSDLPGLGDRFQMASITSFVRLTGKKSYQELSSAQRDELLYLLHTAPSNKVRASAMMLRNSYLSAVYHSDKVMEAVTGVTLPPTIRPGIDAFLRASTLVFPRSKLFYAPEQNELQCLSCTIDYLIVGSGPAGSVIASELRRKGATVVVVDKGPFVLPGTLETRSFAALQESAGRRTSEDGGIYFRNGNALGGGTTVNVDLAFSPTLGVVEDRIQRWRAQGEIDAQEFTPERVSQAYQWVTEKIGTRTLGDDEINANNRVLFSGAEQLHLHPKLYHLNTYAPGTSPYVVTDKKSALTQLLLPAMLEEKNPLTVLPDMEVSRVLFDQTNGSKRAVGVEVRILPGWQQKGVLHDPYQLSIPVGKKFTIHAKNVILCAGTLGSATILHESSILNPLIGTGLIIHPSIPLIGVMPGKTHILEGTQASVFVDDFLRSKGIAFEAMSADPGYAAIMVMGDREQNFDVTSQYSRLAGFGVMVIDRPVPANRISIDKDGDPEIEYSLSDDVKDRLRFGIAEAVKIMFAAGATRVYIPSNENISVSKEEKLNAVTLTSVKQIDLIKKLQFIPNRTILTSAHMQASDKAGSSPSTSVVSPDFKVWGTQNLYVMDSSVFPESIGANPMQSIYTFAKIFVDNLNTNLPSN